MRQRTAAPVPCRARAEESGAERPMIRESGRAMGFINLAEKTINAKLVYYGCGMGGKTSSLQAVHEIMCPRNEVQLVSIKTEQDATLLFDFLPIDLGQVEGFKVRIQGFTVPGQPKYRRMRKYVLSGADAVVFVVDSERSRLEENIQSLESLHENLRSNGLDGRTIPLVLQYNKRDLDDVLSEAELDRHFRFRDDLVAFPTVATEARGVFETFVHAAGLLVEAKVRAYGLGKGVVDPQAVAEGARQKLWEISDRNRGAVPRTRPAGTIELTFDDDGRPSGGKSAGQPVPSGDESAPPELDLDIALDTSEGGIDFTAPATTDDDAEPSAALLDASLESSVELARRYGELDRYKALLERKNKELVQVAQNVVHDLNRPLSAIRLMFSSMKKGYLGEVPAKFASAIDNGLTAVEQMERLINDLVDSTRLDFDGVHLEFREVDMTLCVAKVVNNLRYEIQEKDVGVRIEPMPIIRGDEWALTKLFSNLVGNAIQYAHPDRPARIWIGCCEEPERFVFTVRDNGIGVPAKDLPRLFKRFERGGNTGGISGTGLGLHIVREIALGHGGSTWIESEEGKGTTFFVAIPATPVQPPHSVVSAVDFDEVTADARE
jgi:hypothetical protein